MDLSTYLLLLLLCLLHSICQLVYIRRDLRIKMYYSSEMFLKVFGLAYLTYLQGPFKISN